MKATVERRVLLDLLTKADLARAKKRATLPITDHFFLEFTSKGRVAVTGTDLETQVTSTGKAKVERQGEVVVPPTLLGFLKGVKGDNVSLTVKGKSLLVSVDSLNASFDIAYYKPDEYPPVHLYHLARGGKEIRAYKLGEVLEQVLFCAATEELRPVLAGVHFRGMGYGARLEATDGFRLALAPLPMRAQLPEDFVLPRRSAEVAIKLFKGDARIEVVKRNNEHRDIAITSSNVTLVAAAVTGTFPNVDQLLPKGGKKVRFDCNEMVAALNSVEPMARDGSGVVRLSINGGAIKVMAIAGQAGTAEAKVPTPTKGKGKIAFNLKYLKQALVKCNPEVILEITTPASPGLFKSKGSKFIQVLMPMSVQW